MHGEQVLHSMLGALSVLLGWRGNQQSSVCSQQAARHDGIWQHSSSMTDSAVPWVQGHQGWLGGRVHPRLVAVGWAKAQQVYDRRCKCTVICPPSPDASSEELLLGPGGRSYTWECHALHAPTRGSCACSRPACSLVHVLRCKPRAIWQLGLGLPRLSWRQLDGRWCWQQHRLHQ